MQKILFYCLFWLLLSFPTNYSGFIRSFTNTYNRDWRRPTDTLVYVVDILDYVPSSKTSLRWRKLSIDEKRKQLFKLLERRIKSIEYRFAIDPIKGDIYEDPRGDLDFYTRKKRKRQLYKQDMSSWDSSVFRKMQSLIYYLRQHHADYVFQISGIYETGEKDLYWIIRDQDIYALVISADGNELSEYPAEFYIDQIAVNAVFERSY